MSQSVSQSVSRQCSPAFPPKPRQKIQPHPAENSVQRRALFVESRERSFLKGYLSSGHYLITQQSKEKMSSDGEAEERKTPAEGTMEDSVGGGEEDQSTGAAAENDSHPDGEGDERSEPDHEEEDEDEDESKADESKSAGPDDDESKSAAPDDAGSPKAEEKATASSPEKKKKRKVIPPSSRKGRAPAVKGLTIPFRTVKKVSKIPVTYFFLLYSFLFRYFILLFVL